MAVIGAHTLVYTTEPDEVRRIFGQVFGFDSVDAGGGWLIFALPPAELGVHPSEGNPGQHQVSIICDDLDATADDLRAKGIDIPGEPSDEGFGITVTMKLPGGLDMMLYEPRHPLAIKT
jgi:hypothetical protein